MIATTCSPFAFVLYATLAFVMPLDFTSASTTAMRAFTPRGGMPSRRGRSELRRPTPHGVPVQTFSVKPAAP